MYNKLPLELRNNIAKYLDWESLFNLLVIDPRLRWNLQDSYKFWVNYNNWYKYTEKELILDMIEYNLSRKQTGKSLVEKCYILYEYFTILLRINYNYYLHQSNYLSSYLQSELNNYSYIKFLFDLREDFFRIKNIFFL